MDILYSSSFSRAYQGLDIRIKEKAERAEVIFRSNPLDPRLKTHQLHGRLRGLRSFSVDKRIRILFRFLDKTKTKVYFLDIGDHRIYH